jgi:hypothetical protein
MKRAFFFLIAILTAVSLCAQDSVAVNTMKQFLQNITVFNRLYSQEKVYLHFDNTGYYLGETIWFKAYVVNASSLSANNLSSILYVELLNSRGILLETKKLKIVDGQCHGDFYLTPFSYDYHAGFYEIRAYTKMMLNFGEETLFSRVFPVFNQPEKEGDYAGSDMNIEVNEKRILRNLQVEREKTKKRKRLNLDFYPEGGNTVKGLSCRVAFKTTDEKGMGVDIQGEIQEATDETTTFSSTHDGMGMFEYIPDGNKNSVKIHYENKTYNFTLPPCLPEGYTLKVNSVTKENIILQIEKSATQPAIPLGLSVLCRGEAIYFRTIQVDSTPVVLKIPKDKFPEGVNQVTLFDDQGKIYAERLTFISHNREKQYAVEIFPNKEIYAPLERITIDFSTKIPGITFSLSVRDAENTILAPDAGNIRTDLLLSSDLKGCITNPSYYFEADDARRRSALDLLMMVQGWRRYEWKQMAGIEPFHSDYEKETELTIKGKVAGKAKEVKLELALKDGGYLEGIAAVDSLGNFSTTMSQDLYGRYSLLLHAPGLKNAKLNIRLDRWFSPAPKTYSFYETSLVDTKEEAEETGETQEGTERTILKERRQKADSLYKEYEIREITVNTKRGKDLIYDVERDRDKAIDFGKSYPFLAHDYLVEKYKGFIFRSDNPDKPWDNDLSVSGHWDMGNRWYIHCKRFLNQKWKEHSMYDSTIRNSLDEIQKIVIKIWERFPPREPHHITEINAIVPFYFYLYKDMENTYYYYRKDPNYRVTVFDGYSEVKDFYSGRPERENYLPDRFEHSRTLYWNPNVKTDTNGNAQIRFYNNAFCRKIDISAEGITKDGIFLTNIK